jgi:RNA polymerase sigma-70 factor (ECF subfamily)
MLRIIGGLPGQYREFIRMRDIDELSFEEIATLTGQNINTLRVILSRARKSVRDEFRKQTR